MPHGARQPFPLATQRFYSSILTQRFACGPCPIIFTTHVLCSLPIFVAQNAFRYRLQRVREPRRSSTCPRGQSWSKEARGARRGAGMLGQHLGYRTLTAPHARAARAGRLRPQGLARPRPAADIRVPCPLLLLCSCCSTDAHPAAAMTAAAGSRRCSSSKFSRACGARASLRACGVRGRRCPERARGAPASKKSLFPVREYATEGSPGDNFFLLHQSTALDELYPTVPLSQIVTRGKYFISKKSLYVLCTNTPSRATRKGEVGAVPQERVHIGARAFVVLHDGLAVSRWCGLAGLWKARRARALAPPRRLLPFLAPTLCTPPEE